MTKIHYFKEGERHGRLLVIKGNEGGEKKVQCRCDCGSEVEVWALRLSSGRNKSCGCLWRETTSTGLLKHGMSGTKIYNIWAQMLSRCRRPNDAQYANYGGRGITVCERWLDFANFYADMGERPEGRSLDRINNDAGYSPDNCRWATQSEQNLNRRKIQFCHAGHEFTPENTRLNKRGGRVCKACKRDKSKGEQAKARAKKLAAKAAQS